MIANSPLLSIHLSTYFLKEIFHFPSFNYQFFDSDSNNHYLPSCFSPSLCSYFCSIAQSCPTLQLHGLQHSRPPCPSLSLRVCSNSCPVSQCCHPIVSSSVTPFSSCPQSFEASESLFLWAIKRHRIITLGFSIKNT